jgi:hypothetical protein
VRYDRGAVPIDYIIREGALMARASGVLDDETLLAYVREVLADASYAAAHADLFDARAVTDVELTADGVRTVAALIRQSGRSSRKVAIVADAPVMFGMARMFEMLRNDVEVVVFREVGTAQAWLHAQTEGARDAP